VTFAMHWIKAEIHEFVLKNWRIVKVATTKAQRKLFFKLRSAKKSIAWFSNEEVSDLAQTLDVPEKEVRCMEQRMHSTDISFDLPVNEDPKTNNIFAPSDYLSDANSDPAKIIEAQNGCAVGSQNIMVALEQLDQRSRDIIQRRWLAEKKVTLHELAAEYQVSAERIRQLEENAMKKMRGAICIDT